MLLCFDDSGRPNVDECSDRQRDEHEMTRTPEVLALQKCNILGLTIHFWYKA